MNLPEKIDIFGTHFSKCDMATAVELLKNFTFNKSAYICFPSTNTIAKAYQDKAFQDVINKSAITFVDGKFTELYAKLKGNKSVKNVSGYWLMEELLKTDRSHFFYGCDDATLLKMKKIFQRRFPDAKILGFKSPPFIQLNEIYPNDQILSDFREINRLHPDFIWIGISTVKQDFLMHHYKAFLDRGVMIGVGAVFLYHANVIKKGSEIFKKLGLRWVLRVFQEPKRLWNSTVPSLLYFIKLVIEHDILKTK